VAHGHPPSVPRPLEGSYWATLGIVLLALCPNIVFTTAYALMTKTIVAHTGIDQTGLAVTEGLSNAGYAFGALVGGDLTQRFRQRRLFLVCEALFVVGAALSALAWDPVSFGSGRVLQGLATGLLLVVAIPPLVQQFPVERMPVTAAAVNVGFFGAVTVGPLVGGAATLGSAGWRWLFAGLGLLGALGVALALLALPHRDPPDPELKADWSGLGLAAAGTVAPFVAVAELAAHGFSSVVFTVPLAAGTICLVALLVTEYRKREALSPVRPLSTSLPLLGIVVASLGGAVYVTLLELAERYLQRVSRLSSLSIGFALSPQVAGILIAAGVFYLLVRRRSAWIAAFVLGGLLLLVCAAALLTQLGRLEPRSLVLAASGLLGLGAGATVSPALWLAGWSVPAQMVGRVFALVELLRAEADYIVGPVLRQIGSRAAQGSALAHGLRHSIWLTLWLAVGTVALCAAIYLASGVRPQRPDLDAYLDEGEPALSSPRFLERLRPSAAAS